MTRTEISAALANRTVDELWTLLLRNVQSLQSFWARTVGVFAERCDLPHKRDFHLAVISAAFKTMDDWRFRRIPHVKARRKEVDSAISFIRNKAIENPVAKLRIAPAARNAASALRVLLTASCHGYKDTDLALLVAAAVYEIAAVRVLFPFDF